MRAASVKLKVEVHYVYDAHTRDLESVTLSVWNDEYPALQTLVNDYLWPTSPHSFDVLRRNIECLPIGDGWYNDSVGCRRVAADVFTVFSFYPRQATPDYEFELVDGEPEIFGYQEVLAVLAEVQVCVTQLQAQHPLLLGLAQDQSKPSADQQISGP